MSEIPEGIDDHEKPRYTTRRVRYEIDKAVSLAILAERERLQKLIDTLSDLVEALSTASDEMVQIGTLEAAAAQEYDGARRGEQFRRAYNAAARCAIVRSTSASVPPDEAKTPLPRS